MDRTTETDLRAEAVPDGQLKAGIDTNQMAARAGEFAQMLKDEVAARPLQALGVAAFIGFLCGLRR